MNNTGRFRNSKVTHESLAPPNNLFSILHYSQKAKKNIVYG